MIPINRRQVTPAGSVSLHCRILTCAVACFALLAISPHVAQAAPLPFSVTESSQYLIITRQGLNGNTDVTANNYELGANKAPVPSTDKFLDGGQSGGPTLAGNVPDLPANAAPVFKGVGGHGNIAITEMSGELELQNVGVYADPDIGIRMAGSLESLNKSSNSFFNDSALFPNTFNGEFGPDTGKSVDAIDQGDGSPFADPLTRIDASTNEGITYNYPHNPLIAELEAAKAIIPGLAATHLLDVATGNAGELDLFSTATGGALVVTGGNSKGGVDATFTVGSGLSVVDISTFNSPGNDFLVNNANFVIDGPADASVILRLPGDDNMLVANSNILIGNGGIGLNNVMFVTIQEQNDTHFEVNNAVLNGLALWSLSDINPTAGVININDSQGCVQLVADIVDLDNVRFNHCALGFSPGDPPPIPEPSTFILAAIGILSFGLGLYPWRRRRKSL